MPNDNTLGAPTEGLGQTVTFGFKNTPRAGSQGVQRGAVRGGIQGSSGGGMAATQRVQIQESPAVGMLLKVGQGMIDDKIKEARTGAFVTGMQRAMAGEAVAEIAAEQPAWSRVFGDSDAVEGARAYSSERRVQEVMLGFEQNMPELRKMGAAEANSFYIKAVNDALTGDAKTDFAVMSAVQRNLPSVMKYQAQQHYGYMQEEAANQESAAIHASATRLQAAGARLASGGLTQEGYDNAVAEHGLLVTPPIGRDLKNWQDRRAGDINLLSEQGNFHALNAMENVGIMDALTPQQKAAYTRSRQVNEFQHRATFGAQYLDQLREIRAKRADPTQDWTPDKTVELMKEVNTRHRKVSGSKLDFFSPEAMAAGSEDTRNAIDNALKVQANEMERERAKAEALGLKDQAERIHQSAIGHHIKMGTIPTLIGLGKTTNDEVNRVFLPEAIATVNNALSPKADFSSIIRTAVGGWYSDPLKAQLKTSVAGASAGGAMSPTFAATYEAWRKIHVGSDGRASSGYYEEDHAKFLKFNLVHPGPIDVANPSLQLVPAFLGAFGPDANTRGKLDKKEMAEVLSVASKELNPIKWLPEYSGGGRGLRPGMAEFLAGQLQGTAEVLHVTHSPEDAVKAAIPIATQRGLNIVGGYVWQDRDHKPFLKEMQDRIGTSRFMLPAGAETSDAFADIMDKQIEAHGGLGKGSKITMYRGTGDDLIVQWSVEGQGRFFSMKYDAIAEKLMNRFQKEKNAPVGSVTYPGTKVKAFSATGKDTTLGDLNLEASPGWYTFKQSGEHPQLRGDAAKK